jgi:hypothetical protein
LSIGASITVKFDLLRTRAEKIERLTICRPELFFNTDVLRTNRAPANYALELSAGWRPARR